jgi:peptide/nickel transport system substrate-binding protein
MKINHFRSIGKLLIYTLIVIALLAGCAAPTQTAQPTQPAAAEQPTTALPAAAAQPTQAEPAAATAPAQPAAGKSDTLVYATNISDLSTLDPAQMYAWTGILTVNNIYQGLVKFEGTDYSAVKPALAEKWDIKETADGWDLTFTLRGDGKFASGNPVTADDVVYSYQRVVTLKKGPSFLFTDIAGLTEKSFKAADPKTVVISLPKTFSPQVFLSILTFTVGSVVDSKEVKSHEANGDLGSGWLLDHSAGSGAYVLDHWAKETEILLKANPNYTGTKPSIPNVLIQHVLESTNQQFGLEKGDIDIARNLSPEQIAALQGKPDVTTAKGNSQLLVYIGMNQKVKELSNPKVREALRWAVDYDGIITGLLSGNAIKVQTLVPQGLLGYNADVPFQQDVEKAKALLKEAGYEKGLSLELLTPTGSAPGGAAWADIAAKLQADFAQVGVTINIKQTPYSELYATYRAQTHQLIMVEWGPDYSDPDANVSPFANAEAKSIASRNGWNDAEIGKKAHDAALIADPAQREAAYKEVTEYVLHNGPYVVLYQPTEQFGLRTNLKGFEWKPSGWVDFAAISK